MATEADTSDPTSLMKREMEDKEPTGELVNIPVNKVPPEKKKKIESWLSQPLDTIKILEKTEIMHVEEDNIEVASVNATNKDNIGMTMGEIYTKLPRLADEVKNIEENQLNTKELGGWLEEENRGMVRDQKTIGEASSCQNAGVIIQTPDLIEDLGMDFEKLTGLSNKEERMEHASSKDTEDEKNEGKEIPGDDVRDHCILRETVCPENQKTEEATESSDAATEKLSSSLIPAPDIDVNLKENSSMECKEGRQETVELRKKLKDATSTEVPKENVESFFVEKVENMCFEKIGKSEIPHEESETGLNDIIKDDQDESDNQNTILENIAKANSSQIMTGKDNENLQPEADIAFSKPKESMRRRQSGNLPSAEVQTKECKHEEVMVMAGEDDSVAAEDKKEILKYEEDSKQFIQKIEPGNANLRNPLDVAQEEIVTTSTNKHSEKITNREKQVSVHSLEEILRETTKDETNEKDFPEDKNLHPAGVDEMIRNEASDIPNKNGNDFYVTHPPQEETIQVGNENRDQVSTSELGEKVQEEFEVPKEEEKHANDRGLDNTIPAHTCTEGAINLEPTATTCKTQNKLQKSGKLSTEEELKGVNPEEKSEPEKENLGSPLDVGSEKINTITVNEQAEMIVKEEKSRSPERVQEERTEKTITDNDIMEKEISEEKNVSGSDLDDKMTSSEIEIINKNDTELCVNHLVVEETVEMPGEKNVAVSMSKFGHQVHEEFEVPMEEENQVNESSPGNINPGDRCTKGPINLEPTPACTTEHKLEKCGELTTNEELKGINPEEKMDPEKENLVSPSIVGSEKINTIAVDEQAEMIVNEQKPRSPKGIHVETTDETIIANDIEEEISEEKSVEKSDFDERIIISETEILNQNDNELGDNHLAVEQTVEVRGQKDDAVSMSELGDQVHKEFEVPKEEEKHVNERGQDNTIPENTCTEGPIHLESTPTSKIENVFEKCDELSTEEELKGINPEEKSEPQKANQGSLSDVGSKEINIIAVNQEDGMIVKEQNLIISKRVHEERMADKTIIYNEEEILKEKSVSESDINDRITSSETEILSKNGTDLGDNHLVVEQRVEVGSQKDDAVSRSELHERAQEEFDVPKEEDKQNNENNSDNSFPAHTCTDGAINPETITTTCNTDNELENGGEHSTKEESNENNPEEKHKLEKENLESPSDVGSEEINTIAVNEEAEMIVKAEKPRSPEGIHEERTHETIIANDIKVEEISEEKNVLAFDLDDTIKSSDIEILNENDTELGANHLVVEQTVEVGGQKDDVISTSALGDQAHEEFEVPKEEEKHINEKGPDNKVPEHTCTEGAIDLKPIATTIKTENKLEKCDELSTEEELKEINSEKKNEQEKENLGSLSNDEEIGTIAVNEEAEMFVEEKNPIISKGVHEERRKYKTIIFHDSKEEEISEEKMQNVLESDLDDKITSSEIEIIKKSETDLCVNNLVEEETVEVGGQKDGVSMSELGDQVHEEYEVPKEDEKQHNQRCPDNNILEHTCTEAAINPEPTSTTCMAENKLEKCGELSTEEEIKEINPDENSDPEQANQVSTSIVFSEEINTILVNEQADIIVNEQTTRSPKGLQEQRSTDETIITSDIKEENSEEKNVLESDFDDRITSSETVNLNRNDTDLWDNHLVMEQKVEIGGQKDDAVFASEVGVQAHEEFEIPTEEEEYVHERCPDNNIPEQTCTERAINPEPTPTTCKIENEIEKCGEHSTEKELKGIDPEEISEPEKANLGSPSDVDYDEINTIAVNKQAEMIVREENPRSLEGVHKERTIDETKVANDIKGEEISEKKNVLASDLDGKITSSEIEILDKNETDLCVNDLVEEETVEVDCQKDDALSISELGDQVYNEIEVPKEEEKQVNERGLDNTIPEQTCTEGATNPEQTSTTCKTENKLEICGELSTEESLKEVNPDKESEPEIANLVSPSIVGSEKINTIVVNEQAEMIVNKQTPINSKDVHEERNSQEMIIVHDIKEENSEEKMQNVLEPDFDDSITSSEPEILNWNDTDLHGDHLIVKQTVEVGGQNGDAVSRSELGDQVHEEFEVAKAEEIYINERGPDNSIAKHTCIDGAITQEPTPTTCKTENELEKSGELSTVMELKGISHEEKSEPEKANQGSSLDKGYKEINTIVNDEQAEMIVKEGKPKSPEGVHEERTTDGTMIATDIKEEEISEEKNVLESDFDDKIGCSEIEILNKNDKELCLYHLVVEETVEMLGQNDNAVSTSELGDQVRNDIEGSKDEEKHVNERGLDNTIPGYIHTEGTTNLEQTSSACKTESKLENYDELSTEEELKQINPEGEIEPEMDMVSPSILCCEEINTIPVKKQAEMIVNNQTHISPDITEENSEEKNVMETDFDDRITSSEPEIQKNDTDSADNHLIVEQTVEVVGQKDDAFSMLELGDQVHKEFEVNKEEEKHVDERGSDNSIAEPTCTGGAITSEQAPTTCKTENELKKCGELTTEVELKGIDTEDSCDSEKANWGSPSDVSSEEINTVAVNEQAEVIANDIKDEGISNEKNVLAYDLDNKIGSSEIVIPNKNDTELCLNHLVVQETVEVLGQKDDAVSTSEMGNQVHNEIEVPKEGEKHVNERAPDNTVPEHVCTEGPINHEQNPTTCKKENESEKDGEVSTEMELQGINLEEKSEPEKANLGSLSDVGYEEINTVAISEEAEMIVKEEKPTSPKGVHEKRGTEETIIANDIKEEVISDETMQNVSGSYLNDKIGCSEIEIINKNDTELCLNHLVAETVEVHNEIELPKVKEEHDSERAPDNTILEHVCTTEGATNPEQISTTCNEENTLQNTGEVSTEEELKEINLEDESEPEKVKLANPSIVGCEEITAIPVNDQAEMMVKNQTPTSPEDVHEERNSDEMIISGNLKEENSEEKNAMESDFHDSITSSAIEILNRNDTDLGDNHLIVEQTVEVGGQKDDAVSMSELGDQVHEEFVAAKEEEKYVKERGTDNIITLHTCTDGAITLEPTPTTCKTENEIEMGGEVSTEMELQGINLEEKSELEKANLGSPSDVGYEEINMVAFSEEAEMIVKEEKPTSPKGVQEERGREKTIIANDIKEEEISDEKMQNVSASYLDDKIGCSEIEIINKNDTDLCLNHLVAEETVEVHNEIELPKVEEEHDSERAPYKTILEHMCTTEGTINPEQISTCNEENKLQNSGEVSRDEELEEINPEEESEPEKVKLVNPSIVGCEEITAIPVNDQAEMMVNNQTPTSPEDVHEERSSDEMIIAGDLKEENSEEKNVMESDFHDSITSSAIEILNRNDTDLGDNHLIVEQAVEVGGQKDDAVSMSELGDQVHEEFEAAKEEEKYLKERATDNIITLHTCTDGAITPEPTPTTCKKENEIEMGGEVSTEMELQGINLEEKSEPEKANLGSPSDVGYEEINTVSISEEAEMIVKEEKPTSPKGVHEERGTEETIIANDIKEEVISDEKMQNVSASYLDDKIGCSEIEIINKNDTDLCLNHLVAEETVEVHNEIELPKVEEEHDSERAPYNTIIEHMCTTEGTINPEQISTTCNEENKLQNSGEASTDEELKEINPEEESKPEKVKLVSPSIVGCEEISAIPVNDQAEMMVNNQTPTSPEDVHEERSSDEMIISGDLKENSEEKNVMESDFHDSIRISEIEILNRNDTDLGDNHLIVEHTVEVGGQKDDAVSMSELGDQVHEEFEAAKEEEKYAKKRGPDNIIIEHTCTDGAITLEPTPTTCKTENEIEMGGEVSTEMELQGINLEEKSEPEKENLGSPSDVGYEEINTVAISEEAEMIVKEEKPTSPKGVHEERGTEEKIIANYIKEEEISDEKNVLASYLDDKIVSSEIEIPNKNDTELCLNHLVVKDIVEVLGQEDDAVSMSELGDQLHNEIKLTKVEEKHDNKKGLDNTILEHGCTTEGATNPDQTSTTCSTENKLQTFGEVSSSTEEELKEINTEEESEPEKTNLVSSSIVGFEEISTIPVNKEAEMIVNNQTPISPNNGHEERSSDETIIVHDIREENSEEKNVKESDFDNTITSSETEILKGNDTVLGNNNLIVQQTVELAGQKDDAVSMSKLGDQVHNEIEVPMDEEKHANERGLDSIIPEHASTEGSINQKPTPITCKIEDELENCGEFSTEVELQGINLEEKCDSGKANLGSPLAVGSEDINTIAANKQAEIIVKEEKPRSAHGVHEERMTGETIIANTIKEQEISGEKMQTVLASYLDDKIGCSKIEILNKNNTELSLNHLVVEETVEVLGQEHADAVSMSELGDQIHNEIELPKVEENHDNERDADNTILEHACTIEGATNPEQTSMTCNTENRLQNSGEVSTEEELNEIDPEEEIEPEKANLVSPSNVGCEEISPIPVNEQAEMIVNDQTPTSPKDIREKRSSDEMIISHDIKEENSKEKNVAGSDFDDRIISSGTEILNKNGTDLSDNHLIVGQTVEVLGQKDDAVSMSELGDHVHEEFEVAKEKEKRVNERGPDNSNAKHTCTDEARTLEPAPTTSKSGKIRTEEELLGINPEEKCDSEKAYQGSHSNVCSEEINTIAVNKQAGMIVKEENPRSPHGIHEERKTDEKLIGNNIKDEEISDEKNVSASYLDDKITSLEIEILNKNNTESCLNHLVVQETVEVVGQKDDVVLMSELGDQVHNEVDIPKEDEKHANERGPDNTILEHACIEGLRNWEPTRTTFKTENELEKFSELGTEMELKGINLEEKSEPEKVNQGSAFDIGYEDINTTAVNQQVETIVKEEKLRSPNGVDEERMTDETMIATDTKEEEISKEKNVSESYLDDTIGSSEIEILNKNDTELCLNHLVVKETIEVLGQKDDAVSMSELGDQAQNEIQVSKEEEKHDNETASTYKTENKLCTEGVLKEINPEDKSEPEKANLVRPSIVGSEEINIIPVNDQTEMIVSEQSPRVPEGMNEERNTDETIIVSNIKKEISEEKNVSKSDFDDGITSSETEILNKNDTDSCDNHLVVEQMVEAGCEKVYPVSMLELGDQVHEEFEVPKEEEKLVNERGPDNTIPEHTCTEERINLEPAPTTCKTENELEKCGEFSTEEELKGINPEEKFESEKANLGLPSEVGSDDISTIGVHEQAEMIVKEGKPRSPNVAHEERNTDETIIANFIKEEEISEAKNALGSDLDDNITSSENEIQNKNGIDLSFNHLVAEETMEVEGQKDDAVSTSELGDQVHKEFEVPKEEEKFVNMIPEHRCTVGAINPEPTAATCKAEDKLQKSGELSTEEELNEINPKEKIEPENKTFETLGIAESSILDSTTTERAVNMEVTSTRCEMHFKLEKNLELNSEVESKGITATDYKKYETYQKEKSPETEFQITMEGNDNDKTIEEHVPAKSNALFCTGEEEYHHDQEDKNRQISLTEALPELELDSVDQSCDRSNQTNINDPIIYEKVLMGPKIADRGEGTEKEMKSEKLFVTDHSPESTGQHITKYSQENDTKVNKGKVEINTIANKEDKREK
ncbi:uncharacterized protein LOC127799271 isoform X3 [Diospyros lotus]|uniref:uncharacterized protein LOC127799271 isoform X3 n=1 Tax=Diospyros lotus TaxID=55363 RepID=UPI00225A02A9|nr:uncharacterized protein LOC127799271 isoform X3 [Diospyros lotus]